MSKVSRIDVYAGLDIPAFVNDFSATEDEQNKSITITWKAPTEGMHEGGYISPEGLTYYLVTVGSNLQLVYTMLGKDVYEYTYTPETSDDKLTETYFSIIAENEAGRLPENRIPMAMCVMGKPYTLPIADDFRMEISHTPPSLRGLSTNRTFPPPGRLWIRLKSLRNIQVRKGSPL